MTSPGREATPRAIAPGTLVSIPAGTRFSVRIETPLSTSTSKVDDVVRGRLVSGLGSQGLDLFPQGALVTGSVVESIRAGRVRDVSSLSIVFRTLVPAAGAPLAVRAGTVTVQAASQAGKDAKTIGGSAAAGSVVGAVVGGRKGAAVGAAAGAGAGTAVVLTTRGRDVTLPVGTVVEAVILAPLTVSLTPALAAALGQDPR